MGSKRSDKIWNGKGDAQKRGKDDENPWLHRPIHECWDEAARVDAERERCQFDIVYLYDNYIAKLVRDRKTRQMFKQSLGKIHLLMIDFLLLEKRDEVARYSELDDYLPEVDAQGDFPETWLYWKTLDTPPTMAFGPRCCSADVCTCERPNPIAKMFYERFWQGVVIRLCGDGFTKCLLAPRGHLKSEIGAKLLTKYNLIRNPEDRHSIRTITSTLAKNFLESVKYEFEQNNKFMDVFGHLKPSNKREAAWNTEMIQLMVANRRGSDKTIVASGMESENTGTHGDDYVNDDIAAESNTLTAALRAKARGVIEAQQAQCDPGANLTDIGTRWEEDDPHVMFVGEPIEGSHSGSMAEYTSFFVATVLDGDETAKVPTKLTPLGYGKPIWPERWTLQTVAKKRSGASDDRFYCGQYFNQFHGTTNRLFNKAMIRRFEPKLRNGQTCSMLEFAVEWELDITIGADTASGLPTGAEKAKRDDTAACVLGQSKDKTKLYVLDGFCEKLPVEGIAIGLLDLAMKWHTNCRTYNGNFRVGFEKTKWEKFLSPVLLREQRARGIESVFGIELLSHGSVPKVERIRVLVPEYNNGRIFWPEELLTLGVPIPNADGTKKQIEPYDFCQKMEMEFSAYNPYATVDNILDAQAYAFNMTIPMDWKQEKKNSPLPVQNAEYRRSDAKKVPREQPTSYDHEHMARPY